MTNKESLCALTLVFVLLKLCNQLAWSWWWVLSPLWITPVFFIACVAGLAFGALCKSGWKTIRSWYQL